MKTLHYTPKGQTFNNSNCEKPSTADSSYCTTHRPIP